MRVLAVVLALLGFALAKIAFKNLQGSPDEFGMHNLPSTTDSAVDSDSIMFPITLTSTNNGAEWIGDVPVDSESLFVVSILAEKAYDAQLEVQSVVGVDGQLVHDLPVVSDVEKSWFGFNEEKNSLPSKSFSFKKPVLGLWKIKITGTKATNNAVDIYVLAMNESPDRVSSHLLKYETYTGGQVGVQASLTHHAANGEVTIRAGSHLAVADLDITQPNGEHMVLEMHDDGNHGDNKANDGVFGAVFTATQVGAYSAQVVMMGTVPSSKGDVTFLRSSQHLLAIVDKEIELLDSHQFVLAENDEMATVNLRAKKLKTGAEHKYKAYAEVWGVDENGNEKAIAWISGMTIAESVDAETVNLPLKLSMKWVSKANARLPITLKNVYVQDVATSVPITRIEKASVKISGRVANSGLYRYTGDVESMFYGKRPAGFARINGTNSAHKVVLVHGYCSSDVPFPVESFTNGVGFVDAKQSRTHDEYALLLAAFTGSFDSFSVIGHSQGGPASLHLLTFYWSKLDTAPENSNNRLIQSVGSPYRGCGLAGTLASIGSWFGFGCGSNWSLTYEGANLWLATVPAHTRARVHYYTTQYADWSWCSLPANAVLSWPNDGTSELKYSALKGGNNQGHTKKQCHTADMRYPNQCQDATRNAEMNQFAQL